MSVSQRIRQVAMLAVVLFVSLSLTAHAMPPLDSGSSSAESERTSSSHAEASSPTAGINVPILMYHSVADATTACDRWTITRHTFRQQMAALKAYGYTTVSLQDYMNYRNGTATPPEHPIILTFDDGYQDLDTVVRPILEEFGFVGTAFLPTNYIGTETRQMYLWDPVDAQSCPKSLLIWSDEALHSNAFSIGSHSLSHPMLTSLSGPQAQREIAESKAVIESRLGRPVSFFAYPYGDGADSPALWRLLQDAGYQAAVAAITDGIANTATSNVWALPRLMIGEWHSVVLNNGRANDFFMRRIDPNFPLPLIDDVTVTTYDMSGQQRGNFQPGETIHFVVSARNSGSPVDARIVLSLDDDTDPTTPPAYDSHQADPPDDKAVSLVAGATRSVDFYWTVPTNSSPGQYYYSVDVYDSYGILIYKSVPWGTTFFLRPTTPLRYEQWVNAGGPAYTDINGNTWAADQPFRAGSWGYVGGSAYSVPTEIADSLDDPLYQSERFWADTATPGYRFTVPNGRYKVILKFAEVYRYEANSRRFDVRIEGATILSGYDIYADAGGRWRAAPDKVLIVDVADGELSIDFIRLPGYDTPKVNAIQVISLSGAPIATPVPIIVPTATPTPTAMTSPTPTPTASPTPVPIATSVVPAYEQRVNVGGTAYTDDHGNAWAADQPFVPGSWGYVGGRTYAVDGATITTSDNTLYQSERYWSDGGTPGYRFTVPNGRYRVALKFAEIYPYAASRRRFDVRLEGKVVLSDYSIMADAGGVFRPTPDRIFTVDVTDGELTIDFVRRVDHDAPKVNAIHVVALTSALLPTPSPTPSPTPTSGSLGMPRP